MMINKNIVTTILYLTCTALVALAANVQADSPRTQWDKNKHFYQRFDLLATWDNAKADCESRGAHLVTITDANEQSFIYDNLSGDKSFDRYWIGGSDSAREGRYAWVTSEPWTYSYWVSSVYFNDDYDYVYTRLYSSPYSKDWDNGKIADSNGYICEWSSDTYAGLAIVSDLNNNGSDEIATLSVNYVAFRHRVKIIDPKTDTLISTLTFKSDVQAPQGIVAIEDINRNHIPEIGVLYSDYGQPAVLMKDAKNDKAYLKTLRFLNKDYNPKEVTVSPDSNGNGSSEITVLGIHKTTNAPKAEMRDSKTGELLSDTTF